MRDEERFDHSLFYNAGTLCAARRVGGAVEAYRKEGRTRGNYAPRSKLGSCSSPGPRAGARGSDAALNSKLRIRGGRVITADATTLPARPARHAGRGPRTLKINQTRGRGGSRSHARCRRRRPEEGSPSSTPSARASAAGGDVPREVRSRGRDHPARKSPLRARRECPSTEAARAFNSFAASARESRSSRECAAQHGRDGTRCQRASAARRRGGEESVAFTAASSKARAANSPANLEMARSSRPRPTKRRWRPPPVTEKRARLPHRFYHSPLLEQHRRRRRRARPTRAAALPDTTSPQSCSTCAASARRKARGRVARRPGLTSAPSSAWGPSPTGRETPRTSAAQGSPSTGAPEVEAG